MITRLSGRQGSRSSLADPLNTLNLALNSNIKKVSVGQRYTFVYSLTLTGIQGRVFEKIQLHRVSNSFYKDNS